MVKILVIGDVAGDIRRGARPFLLGVPCVGMRVAAVDVGTNSVRLLVAEAGLAGRRLGSKPLRHVERHMRITRLGKGIDEHGRFDDTSLERTLACIGDYARRWRELGAQQVRVAATSAVRDAEDRDRFFDGVRQVAGVDAEVLSGEEEAHTAFVGATALIDAAAPYLVLDIGGGSTELILGESAVVAAVSRQLGCVRLHERCLPSDPPEALELTAAAEVVAEHLDAVADAVPVDDANTLVAVAGTATTLGALHLGLDAYEPERIHGTRMPLEAVQALTAKLALLPSAERAKLGPMAPGREDVIVAGALILQAVMERYGFAEVLVSEADILDGLALGLLRSR